MAEDRIIRSLSAILAADIAGYSRLMEADEDATISGWKTARLDVIDPKIAEFSGHIVKHTGDGFLAEFSSVNDAVNCAIDMQKLLTERSENVSEEMQINFRMGVNIGDIVHELDDIHGDGVNIAARMEGLADPGGICVTASVYEQMHKNNQVSFEDLGLQKVKNIAEPIHTYRINVGFGDQDIPIHAAQEPTRNLRSWLIGSVAVTVILGTLYSWSVLDGAKQPECADHLGLQVACPQIKQ